ncbi:MAG: adenylate/guanylate cyclase domain-containing protein [Hyphomicrobiaceae bacterium]
MQILLRGNVWQRGRLVSGLILFCFVLTHFLNHATGLFDVQIMHDFQQVRIAVTRSWPGTIILLFALITHIVLALAKVAERRTWNLPPWELLQLALGLLIPFLLFPHIVNTRIASTYFGVEDSYLYELARLWPASAVLQSTLLVIVWIHACIGIHFWLRLYSPYRAIQPVLIFLAIAIPLAALAGFMKSGEAVAQLIKDPEKFEQVKQLTHWPNAVDNGRLGELRGIVRLGFLGLIALVAAYIGLRYLQRLTAPKISVRYVGGPTVRATPGASLLEISRQNRIPHASVCGGRARCSTCRVRIDDASAPLPLPVFPESLTLGAIQAPPNVRLACQIRPTSSLTVTRLLRPGSTGPNAADLQEMDSGGVEKDLAVLYLNMRDFTQLSKRKLPYDVVFILNSFFNAAGTAVATQGGWIDRVAGDGFYAVFGQKHGAETGCRQALRAARAIDLALDHVNAVLASEIAKPMQVGIGIHAGTLLLGRVGFGEAVDLTAIGPAVKTARALEDIAKREGMQIVLSERVAKLAGWPSLGQATREMDLPGFGETMNVVTMVRGRDMPATILAGTKADGGGALEDAVV